MMETARTAIVDSDPFKYTALNLQAPSIRLIRLKPDLSRDGHIQCEIRHSSIEDDFVCLSYVWGNDSAGQWIFINEKAFWVRENLWRFLWSTWQKRIKDSQSTWYWIDALCIDQENNIERGHQVQQMGAIYAQASLVISWLGWDEKIEQFFSAASLRNNKVVPGKDLRLCDSEYWSRAWMTQELMLNRSVILSAGTAELPFEKLGSCCRPRDDSSERSCRNVYNMQPDHREGFKGLSMFQLLAHFDRKKSTIPRDKIFSLLAISRDSANIKADYNISDKELVCKILQACEPLVCLCSVRNLCNVLEISDFCVTSDNTSLASIALMTGWKTLGDRCLYIAKPLLAFDTQLFAVNLDKICQAVAFGGGYLVVYAKFGEGSFWYKLIGRIGCIEDETWRMCVRKDRGTAHVSEDGSACILHISLELLLEISKVFLSITEDPILCGRGAGWKEADPWTGRLHAHVAKSNPLKLISGLPECKADSCD